MKVIQKRRRRESKTDYKARKNMLKSGNPRIVFRKTNKYIIGQLIKSENAQDKVFFTISSKKLLEKGWPENKKGSLKSLPASYLTGYLLGKSVDPKLAAIFDIGMIRNIPKSRTYAFLKGIIDAGVKINHNDKNFPSEKDIKKNKDFEEVINKIVK